MYSKPQLLEAVEEESKLNGIKVFEDIKDKDGHARFVEGEINIETMAGVTKTYGKWTLSGSYLMLVLVLAYENGTVSSVGRVCNVELPQWVLDKLITTATTWVAKGTYQAYASDNSSQDIIFEAFKATASGKNVLAINTGGVTITAARQARISFDFLIDMYD